MVNRLTLCDFGGSRKFDTACQTHLWLVTLEVVDRHVVRLNIFWRVDGDVVSVESWSGMKQQCEAHGSYLMHDGWAYVMIGPQSEA